MRTIRLRSTLLLGSAAIASFGFITSAHAQDQQSTSEQSANAPDREIVVTGSRIARRDYEANSPIVTASQSLLRDSSTAAIETNLNKLPQFTPDKTPASGAGDIQATATNTPGSATVSLRNLGANRSIVLIDGRRATPANATMVVDINTIPAAAIERVEIISGGASATYGADAVAGVVNFIMKKNFQGLALDGQMAISQRGDAFEYNVSGIMGANFDDGRGNVTISFSNNRREAALRVDRPWYQKLYRDPNIAGTEFFSDFTGINPFAGVGPSQGAIDAAFGPGSGVSGEFGTIFANADGTPFTGMDGNFPGGAGHFNGDITGLKWKQLANGTLAQNFMADQLQFPLNRYNMFVRGNYEVNDWLSVFAQGMFTKVKTTLIQQPSPAVNGWAVVVPNDAAHPVPAGIAALLNNRVTTAHMPDGSVVETPVDPSAPYQLTDYLNFANRSIDNSVTSYNMLAGVDGKIPGTDWTWEIYGSHGESETNVLQKGFVSLARLRAVLSAPNWGKGFTATGNAEQGGFGASTATCTSGMNPFDYNLVISQDCIDTISANLQSRTSMTQSVWEGTAQGTLFNLPGGQVKASIGASYRENSLEYINDSMSTQGSSFNDQIVGIYPSGNTHGTIKAREVFAELLVPILSDTFIKKLELELGGRYSDYNTTGGSWTYKALANLELTDWLRFRGGYNRAERAPNLGELYLAPQQSFGLSFGGDPCSVNSGLAWGANPATNTEGTAAQVKAFCTALMEKTSPNSSTAFYGNASFQGSGFTYVFPTLSGNPNLKPEKADTWTAGTVISSPWSSPMLRGLRLAIDYYDISVKDAIGAQSVDVAMQQCLSTEFNPTLDQASPYCAGFNRNAGVGTLGNVITTFLNNGRFRTNGIDAQFDWILPAGPGQLALNSTFNYVFHYKSSELATNPLLDYAGTLGPSQNGLNPGVFRWKLLTNVNYSIGAVTVGLQWQHLPSIRSVTYATNHATTTTGAPAYDLFGLVGSVKVVDNATIRFGVDNLFDKAPPLTEVNTAPPPGTLSGGVFNTYFYDLNGRRFYIGASFKF